MLLFYKLDKTNNEHIKRAIFGSGNATFIYTFATKFDNTDSALILQSLCSIGNDIYRDKYNHYLERITKVKRYSNK